MFALIMAGFGTVMAAYGAISGGYAQQKMADRNAQVAMQQAQAARMASAAKAKLIEKEGKKHISKQETLYRKSGVTLAGSPEEVIKGTASDIAHDVALALWGGETEATRFESQAAMDKWTGKQYKRAGWIKGFGSLLAGTAGINIAASKMKV